MIMMMVIIVMIMMVMMVMMVMMMVYQKLVVKVGMIGRMRMKIKMMMKKKI
jgi:hypothetical protein